MNTSYQALETAHLRLLVQIFSFQCRGSSERSHLVRPGELATKHYFFATMSSSRSCYHLLIVIVSWAHFLALRSPPIIDTIGAEDAQATHSHKLIARHKLFEADVTLAHLSIIWPYTTILLRGNIFCDSARSEARCAWSWSVSRSAS